MKRLMLLFTLLASGLAAGCASSSSGAGGGAMFTDCYDDDCVGYDALCHPSAYLRAPSAPAVPRAEVGLTSTERPGPQTVIRSAGTTGVIRSTAAPRAAPAAPAPSRPPTTTARRP